MRAIIPEGSQVYFRVFNFIEDNEIENVEAIIRAVVDLGQGYHILIVDDNSPDGTADKVRELQAEFNGNLHLEVRKEKLTRNTPI